jgi:subtilisin family serine protease
MGPALVRLLQRPGHRHPFADRAGRIPITVKLPPDANAADLGLLEVAPGIGAIRLVPEDVGAYAALHPDLTLTAQPALKPLLNVSATWNGLAPFQAAASAAGKGSVRGQGVAVGVVDTGIDILHPDFRDSQGNTRVAWLLLGGQNAAGLEPDLESQFGCTDPSQSPCAIYSAADINALIAKGGAGIVDSVGHGTHVTSIAAGNGGVIPGGRPTYVGVAPEATLLIAAAGDIAGFAPDDILRGATFVVNRADSMGLPLAINVSLGTDYGPHDGTSTLETGLSALVGDSLPGHVMVIAAGNSGGLLQLANGGWGGIHTDAYVSPDEVVRVPFVSPAASAADESQILAWLAWRPGSNLQVALEGPDHSTWIGFTGGGEQGSYQDAQANEAFIVNTENESDIDLTATENSAVVVIQGNWGDSTEFAIQLRGQGYADLWLTSNAIATPGALFTEADEDGSVSTPATAPGLLSVGCTVNRIRWTTYTGEPIDIATVVDDPYLIPDNACGFSGRGPTRTGLAKPEISAPGGFVVGAMSSGADPRTASGQQGLFAFDECPTSEACLVVDNHHAVAQGTSMSAPQVTGAAALLLEIDPTLTEARTTATLRAGARQPTSPLIDPDQLGSGALDLASALNALEGYSGGPPDATQSWYTLSNPFAYPDLSSPVFGIIELRDANEAIATVDETKLVVSGDGVLRIQQPTRIQGSAFQFAFSAPASSVGAEPTLDVTYDGVSLGSRTIVVAQDLWRAAAPIFDSASGGACNLVRAHATSGHTGTLAMLATLLTMVAARRARPRRQG